MIKHRIRQYLTGVLILLSVPAFTDTRDYLARHPAPYRALHGLVPVDLYV